MADDDAAEDEGGEGGGGGGKKKSKKKLIIIIVLVLVLLIGGGGAGAYFAGLLGGGDHSEEAAADGEGGDGHGEGAPAGAHGEGGEGQAAAGPGGDVVFYEMAEMVVNMNTGGKQATYLKLIIALELDDAAAPEKLKALEPRVRDHFQVYLRELRLEDLNGSAGMFRLKEELLMRVNQAVSPIRVNDILFKEILVH